MAAHRTGELLAPLYERPYQNENDERNVRYGILSGQLSPSMAIGRKREEGGDRHITQMKKPHGSKDAVLR
jgi:hypothetical protein